MKKKNIEVEPSKCATCLTCQLRCSLAYTGAFNIAKARINIDAGEISFTDECIENCSLCTNFCVYGAIIRIGRG
jgi:NAD-dependent dihydropyrimidine dehydrogenase PreA subunit